MKSKIWAPIFKYGLPQYYLLPAVRSGCSVIVKVHVEEFGIDLNSRVIDEYGHISFSCKLPIYEAAKYGEGEIFDYLLNTGSNPLDQHAKEKLLFEAIKKKN